MRKFIVLSFITLDGVMQAPGGPDEDKESGFKYGGWSAPYADEASGKFMQKQMKPTDMLLGRKTYEIFADYWPTHEEYWPKVNDVTKYVVSKSMKKTNSKITGWKNSVLLKGLADIKKLKNTKGDDIKIWGSAKLIQSLLKNDLVDELWLKIYPLTLGKGKRLFEEGAIPAAFSLTETSVTPSGVIFANYKRAGKVTTGTMGV